MYPMSIMVVPDNHLVYYPFISERVHVPFVGDRITDCLVYVRDTMMLVLPKEGGYLVVDRDGEVHTVAKGKPIHDGTDLWEQYCEGQLPEPFKITGHICVMAIKGDLSNEDAPGWSRGNKDDFIGFLAYRDWFTLGIYDFRKLN